MRRGNARARLKPESRIPDPRPSPPNRVIRGAVVACHHGRMLTEFSTQLADVVDRVAPGIVQVQGSGRPATGVVHSDGFVVTTARAIGREEQPRVRRADGETLEAQVVGVDPASRVAVLKVPGLDGQTPPHAVARVGEVAIALARSWSNAITATAGLVSVIGGPLQTGRYRAIETVIRTSAPMHEGFSGGALLAADGRLLGIATAAAIRGLGVVIPASIASAAVEQILERGGQKRGYLGVAAQPVRVSGKQAQAAGAESVLLIVGVRNGTPADTAGLLVGDLLLTLDGHPLTSPEELYDLLVGERVGRSLALRVLRGGSIVEVPVTPSER